MSVSPCGPPTVMTAAKGCPLVASTMAAAGGGGRGALAAEVAGTDSPFGPDTRCSADRLTATSDRSARDASGFMTTTSAVPLDPAEGTTDRRSRDGTPASVPNVVADDTRAPAITRPVLGTLRAETACSPG